MESGARQAVNLASTYADRPYQPYQGQRIADLSANEQLAVDRAREAAGAGTADTAAARGALEGVQDFSQFDPSVYMDPYIKGALDPTARELREEAARRSRDIRGRAASVGAFSGSRTGLGLRESDELLAQNLSDLYGRGYSEAFRTGADLWQADQDRAITQAGEYMRLAGVESDLATETMNRLLTTGAEVREVDQLRRDFDYGQFIEGRDWDARNAALLVDALSGLQGTYSVTTETKEKEKANPLGQLMGLAGTVGGFIMAGPAGAAAGSQIGSAIGGGGVGQGALTAPIGGQQQSVAPWLEYVPGQGIQ